MVAVRPASRARPPDRGRPDDDRRVARGCHENGRRRTDGEGRRARRRRPTRTHRPSRRRARPSSPFRPRSSRTRSGSTSERRSRGSGPARAASCRSSAGCCSSPILFQSLNRNFLTAGNLVNLLVQAAVFSLLAMGEVFALLLGEIDLSVGYVARARRRGHGRAREPGSRLAVVGRDRRRAARLRRDRAAPGHDHHPDRPALVHRHARRPALLGGRAPEDPRQRRDDHRSRTTRSTTSQARTSARSRAGS